VNDWGCLWRGLAGLGSAWVVSTLLWLGLLWVALGWTAGVMTFAALWGYRAR